jgi:hypothetical protein
VTFLFLIGPVRSPSALNASNDTLWRGELARYRK